MKILITGACGFLGRHLSDYMRKYVEGLTIYTVDTIDCRGFFSDNFFQVDLLQEQKVRNIVKTIMPDCLIHLAGLFGSNDTLKVFHANVTSLLILLEAVRKICPSTVVLTAGSAAEYGNVGADQLPITENTPCYPINIYGQTKYLATQCIEFYYRVYGLTGMVFRPFQLIGQGVSTKLAPGAFAEQVIQSIHHNNPVIKVGNLNNFRDFLNVDDAVAAIWQLCKNPAPGEIFNICSGQAMQMASLLDEIIRVAGVNVKIEIDETRFKDNEDVSNVHGSFAKIQAHCKWEPVLPLTTSIKSMIHGLKGWDDDLNRNQMVQ